MAEGILAGAKARLRNRGRVILLRHGIDPSDALLDDLLLWAMEGEGIKGATE